MKALLAIVALILSLIGGLIIGHAPGSAMLAEPVYGLSLTKTANVTSYQHAGQVIRYTFVITNSGDYRLLGPFFISDSKTPMVVCAPDSSGWLEPGETITCSSSYTITSRDMLEECVTNAAYVEGGGMRSDLAWSTIYNDNRVLPNYLPLIQHA